MKKFVGKGGSIGRGGGAEISEICQESLTDPYLGAGIWLKQLIKIESNDFILEFFQVNKQTHR